MTVDRNNSVPIHQRYRPITRGPRSRPCERPQEHVAIVGRGERPAAVRAERDAENEPAALRRPHALRTRDVPQPDRAVLSPGEGPETIAGIGEGAHAVLVPSHHPHGGSGAQVPDPDRAITRT